MTPSSPPVARAALKDIEREVGTELRGYGDMTVEEVAARTGLSPRTAALSKQREYDEPFVISEPTALAGRFDAAIHTLGSHQAKGGRFSHLMGSHDKGRAV